jgi:Flp pilus assembly protein TadG
MKFKLNLRTKKKGQSLVEFALTLILIMTLLAGAVDLGTAFFIFIELRDAAQEGALYGATAAVVDTAPLGKYNGEPVNTAAIEARVRQSSTSPADLSNVTTTTVTVEASNPPCSGGSMKVTIRYNYTLTMPLIGGILGTQTIPIRAEMTDTILKPSCP